MIPPSRKQKYVREIKLTSPIETAAPPLKACSCTLCEDSPNCEILKLNNNKPPYDRSGNLRNLDEHRVFYECNKNCRCGPNCFNRVAQKGPRYRLELFKTKAKGWGVRAADPIPRGAFIDEYLGELISEQEADRRGVIYDKNKCSYLFDLDHQVDKSNANDCSLYTIKAACYASITRYINHSCDPNTFTKMVLWDHHDVMRPHLCFFSVKEIRAGEELTFDYKYEFLGSENTDTRIKCHCGAPNCRGFLL